MLEEVLACYHDERGREHSRTCRRNRERGSLKRGTDTPFGAGIGGQTREPPCNLVRDRRTGVEFTLRTPLGRILRVE